MTKQFPAVLFQKLLLYWYSQKGRVLVWRETLELQAVTSMNTNQFRDPYYILVAEMMLQQTQVSTVIPKYNAFLEKWPTIQALSAAKLSQVLIAWKGLGYNRRAKYLLETAKIIAHDFDGLFPSDHKALIKLPGFGPYMVSAIRVFAFGFQDPVIDVNVARVLSRVAGGRERVEKKELDEIAEQLLPKGQADSWHQALMDFGALICKAKSPTCASCPLANVCQVNHLAIQNGYPSYMEFLVTLPRRKKGSVKDKGKRFEETDRYYRGRIIDLLRGGPQPMQQLSKHLGEEHQLSDRRRFGLLIESLVVDGLIKVAGTTVELS